MSDRVAVVTGVGRRQGIGFAIARRLLADRAITVNAINPGPVDTGWPSEELRAALTPGFPAGRWGRPEDIAGIVASVISPDCAWLTGQVLDAEGGFRRLGTAS